MDIFFKPSEELFNALRDSAKIGFTPEEFAGAAKICANTPKYDMKKFEHIIMASAGVLSQKQIAKIKSDWRKSKKQENAAIVCSRKFSELLKS